MSKNVRREIPIPRFKPLPTHLRRHAVMKQYARFYVLYETPDGRMKRASWHVPIPESVSGKMNYKMIRFTVDRIKNFKMIPLIRDGEEIPFGKLHQRTRWIKVKRIKFYEAGMRYKR